MIRMMFNESDYKRIMRVLDNFSRKSYVQNVIAEPMQRRCATGFHHLLISNLNNASKFADSSWTYRHRYAAWKKSWGGYWKLSGDLIRAVVKIKSRNAVWQVGIKDMKDSGGKSWFGKTASHPGSLGKSKSIGMYATVMEYGTPKGHPAGEHPPRPLFGPTRDEYEKSDWPAEGKRATQTIRGRWR